MRLTKRTGACALALAMLICLVAARMAYAGSEVESLLVSALERQEERIDVRSLNCTMAELEEIYFDTLRANPDLFYVAGECKMIYRMNSGVATAIEPTYRYSGDELQRRMAAFESETERILSLVPAGLSPLEQALFMNDLFCLLYSYDTSATRYHADDLLLDGTGTCDAYTNAYSHMLNRLGIETSFVESEAMVHSWVQVKLDGEWYHVDVSWNDPLPDIPGAAMHRFFLLSDVALADDAHMHYDWSAKHVSGSTRYDSYFWDGVNTPFVYLDEAWYYMPSTYDGGNVYIRAWTPGSGETRDVFSFSTAWPVWGDERRQWMGAYSGLSARDGKLIYSTATQIWSIFPDATGDVRLLRLPDDAHGYIYSLFPLNGSTYYTVSTSPDVAGELYELPAA